MSLSKKITIFPLTFILIFGMQYVLGAGCANMYNQIKLFLKNPDANTAADITQKIALAQCDQNSPEYLIILNNLALLNDHVHHYEKGESLYKQVLEVIQNRVGKEHADYAKGLDNLAHLYMDSGAFNHAEEILEQALAIRKRVLGEEHPDYGHTLNTLAGIYYQHGEQQRAGELFQQAAAIWQNHYGEEHPHAITAVNNQAWNHLESGDHKQAIRLFEKTLQNRENIHGDDGHHEVANTLTGLAHAHTQDGNPEHAEKLLRRALPMLHHDSHTSLLWQVQHYMSQNLAAQGHTGAAVLFGKKALESLHGLKHTAGKQKKDSHQVFMADKGKVYREIVDLLMQQGRVNESHHIVNMLREEELLDFLHRDKESGIQHSLEPVYAPHEEEWIERYAAINQNLADFNRRRGILLKKNSSGENVGIQVRIDEVEQQIISTEKSLHKYLDDLKQEYPEHAPLETDDLEHLHELQEELTKAGPGTVALHYILADDGLHIILTTLDKQTAHRVAVKDSVIKEKIRLFRSVAQNLTRSPKLEAKALYQYLIAPIEQELTEINAKTLLIAADGVLRYIPFSAIYDGKNYLIERYALVMHNDVIENIAWDSRVKDWHFTGLGLSQKVEGFSALPSVEEELTELSKVLDGDVHLNEQFNRQTFNNALKDKRPVLHIASHFVLKPGTERDSYLLLGNGDVLSLAELRNGYDFSGINLLTLSACNTAMGTRSKGSEVDGLAALARHKGAHSVLATLWYISDAGTGKFMQRFYQIREKKKLQKAAALRETQLAFIKGEGELIRFSHPFYWAPFILMGDWL